MPRKLSTFIAKWALEDTKDLTVREVTLRGGDERLELVSIKRG